MTTILSFTVTGPFINLRWTDQFERYNLYRSTSAGVRGQLIASNLTVNHYSFSFHDLCGTLYFTIIPFDDEDRQRQASNQLAIDISLYKIVTSLRSEFNPPEGNNPQYWFYLVRWANICPGNYRYDIEFSNRRSGTFSETRTGPGEVRWVSEYEPSSVRIIITHNGLQRILNLN